jgi:6-phosphofructokinase 1
VADKIDAAGTIILTSRTNPLKEKNGIERVILNMNDLKLDALIAIGGDDTLSVAAELASRGVRVVGVPKTIDNDVESTDFTFGFFTAVEQATEVLDNLKVTTLSHERVMVVEIMGRNAGWITLYAGTAAGADLVLIPERPFKLSDVINFVKEKKKAGKGGILIAVAEGAVISDYKREITKKDVNQDAFGHEYLGGIGNLLAKEIEQETGFETRAVAPAHIIRGKRPIAFDRVLATRFGIKALQLVADNDFGKMVALSGTKIVKRDLKEVSKKTRSVDNEIYEELSVFF